MTHNQNSTRYYSSRQEKKVAQDLHMRVQSNSGATAFNKGDLVDDDLLVECKTCVKSQRQFTLKKEWFLKMKQEQIAMRKAMSALVFDFGDGNNYVAVDIQTFKALLRAFKEME